MDLPTIVQKGTMSHGECALYLGVTPKALYGLTHDHGLPYAQPGGSRSKRLYSRKLVDEWTEAQCTLDLKTTSRRASKAIGLAPRRF